VPVSLTPQLQAIFDEIMAAHPKGLTLDELSEALLMKPVTYADIDEIIGALEDAGVDLDAPAQQVGPEELAPVLAAARELAQEHGRRPTPEEIGARTGLSPSAVRRALAFGRSLREGD
jgi:DNA-binding transcriptional LysR family regulator